MATHAMTIDVEDWYHVENLRPVVPSSGWADQESRLTRNVDRLLELFADCGLQATFFVLGRAAEREPSVVRSIVDAGHELACHGWSHELVYRQTRDVFREETRRAKSFLEDVGGVEVLGYRASTFSIVDRSLWALDVLAEEGFAYDSSIAPLRHDRYGIPGARREPHARSLPGGGTIVEYPVSLLPVLGWNFPLGGGFFRLFPLAWTRRALGRYEARGESGMIYLHPWEFDKDQPRPGGLGLIPRFRHYYGLAGAHSKLRRLVEECSFASVLTALESCGLGRGYSESESGPSR